MDNHISKQDCQGNRNQYKIDPFHIHYMLFFFLNINIVFWGNYFLLFWGIGAKFNLIYVHIKVLSCKI